MVILCDSCELGQISKVRFQSAVAFFVFDGVSRMVAYLVDIYGK